MLAFSHSSHSVVLAESKFICQQAILIPQGHTEINILSFMSFFSVISVYVQYYYDDITLLLEEYIKTIPNEDISQTEKIAIQLEHLSYIQATNREEDRRVGYVREVYQCKRKADGKVWAYNIKVTFLGKGKNTDFTVYKAKYDKCKLKKGDIFYADQFSSKMYQDKKS